MGSLVNTGTIESLTMEETGAAVRQLNAEIDNRSTGVINVNSLGTLTNNTSAANHKNAGQINLNNGNYSSAAMESFENSGNVAGRFPWAWRAEQQPIPLRTPAQSTLAGR